MSEKPIQEIIKESIEKGDHSGWFEHVYASGTPPWSRGIDPGFKQYTEETTLSGKGQTAVVIGCGLGDDAEFLASMGFQVTAFDISETAITRCRERFPETVVNYQQADLFNVPDTWTNSFDFVFENRTIQALPLAMAEKTMRAVENLLAKKGRLLILCHGREENEPKQGVPWSLSRSDLTFFEQFDLQEIYFKEYHDGKFRRFMTLFQR